MPAEPAAYSAQNWQDYIKTRVDFKTEAYRKKGEWYRWGYLIMACTSAVFAATVPVLINLKQVPSITDGKP